MNVKIGNIYRRSWGYDQTNVDYYQVVALKAKSVVVKQIKYAEVPKSAGFMSCNVVPLKDQWENENPQQVRVSPDGQTITVGPKKHAHLVPQNADGSYPSTYCSWYA